MSLLNICLKLPNLGLITYHVVFVIIIPFILISLNQVDALKYYWPIIVALAVTFTQTGKPFIFQNLYNSQPKNLVSFISTNLINLVAVMGIIWQATNYYSSTQNLEKTILIGLILFAITFPLAREGTEFVIRKGDEFMKNRINTAKIYNSHKFIFGFFYIILLLGIQLVLLNLTKKIEVSSFLTAKKGVTAPHTRRKRSPAVNTPVTTPVTTSVATPVTTSVATNAPANSTSARK